MKKRFSSKNLFVVIGLMNINSLNIKFKVTLKKFEILYILKSCKQ